jgi:hypothetical protein
MKPLKQNNMEQTAVEWLEIEIKKQIFQCETQWQCGYQKALNEVVFLLKQTKEMEKQKTIDFAYEIADDLACDVLSKKAIEDRYNQFFKSE